MKECFFYSRQAILHSNGLFNLSKQFSRFNPIENLFGFVKRNFQDFEFSNNVKGEIIKRKVLAFKIMKVMFTVKKYTF